MNQVSRKTSTLLLTIFLALVTIPAPSEAQDPVLSPNSSLSVDLARLAAELEPLSAERCRFARCETNLSNVPATIRASGYPGGVSIWLTHAKVLNHIKREQHIPEVDNSRPVLLRGIARVRHSHRGKTERLRIAGTIFRPLGSPPILEISLPPMRPHGKRGSGIALVRAPLSATSSSQTTPNARYTKSSAHAFPHATCRARDIGTRTAAVQESKSRERRAFSALATYKVVYLATDFDQAFSQKLKCLSVSDCNNKIVSIVNHAAVYYENQLGMTLEVARQFGPTNPSTSTESGSVLDSFIAYNDTNRNEFFHDGVNTGPNLIDVFAFYTGRMFDEGVIGLAYLDTGCRNFDSRYATMEIQRFAATVDPITTAHEMGHIFSADHDSAGVNAIMQPSLGGQNPTRFSAISAAAITQQIDSTYSWCRQGYSTGSQDKITPTIRLTISKTRTGRFTFAVTTDALRNASCAISIRAATTSKRTSSGRLIKKFVPTSLRTTISGTLKRLITASSEAQSNVYLQALYTCSDGSQAVKSDVKVVNPNKKTSVTGSKVTRSEWIKLLDKAFP